MWRASERNARPPAAAAGFSLVELLVVLMMLGMILMVVGQLFFPMRTAAERQRLDVEARQTARAAADYLAFSLRGATDANPLSTVRNPMAVLTWVVGKKPGNRDFPGCPGDGDCVQVSFNNVANPALADLGTDIITVGQLDEPFASLSARWPGFTSGANAHFFFDLGCPSDDDNLARFKQLTGFDAGTGWSKPILFVDEDGNSVFGQITDYKDGQNATSCSAPDPTKCEDVDHNIRPCLWIVFSPNDQTVNIPGGHRDLCSATDCDKYLLGGVTFRSFRVCDGWLQQKNGIFDPVADANCGGNTAGWTSLLPNVEDLQVAYVFTNGQIMNTATDSLAAQPAAGGCVTDPSGVPCQGLHNDAAAAFDVTRIIGFRITVVGRSGAELPLAVARVGRLPAEDHVNLTESRVNVPASPDRHLRYLVSANALLRNRIPDGF
ncbi:MAG TPA: type II secretion system protein [Thermoanaerobaculaceae bacterium]|nr:type II secretion system protein [Thermoanaerobaculaceae bacterium]HRS15583.1 type II secretion system protein [Thermoanaerobaculaceae bacterium]